MASDTTSLITNRIDEAMSYVDMSEYERESCEQRAEG